MGISKGLAMQRILAAMAERCGPGAVAADFVLAAGHFLARDENLFTFFEGHALKARAAHTPCLYSLPGLGARRAGAPRAPAAPGCAACRGRGRRRRALGQPGSSRGGPPPARSRKRAPWE